MTLNKDRIFELREMASKATLEDDVLSIDR